ncbi:MAG: hypothetical protein WBQ64_06045 [Terriglobales bacterium]
MIARKFGNWQGMTAGKKPSKPGSGTSTSTSGQEVPARGSAWLWGKEVPVSLRKISGNFVPSGISAGVGLAPFAGRMRWHLAGGWSYLAARSKLAGGMLTPVSFVG